MENIIVFKCSYCGFYKKTKKIVELHEKRCFWNPDTKSCATCLWYSDRLFKEGCGEELKKGGSLKTKCEKHVNRDDYMEKMHELLLIHGMVEYQRCHEEVINLLST